MISIDDVIEKLQGVEKDTKEFAVQYQHSYMIVAQNQFLIGLLLEIRDELVKQNGKAQNDSKPNKNKKQSGV